jgi:cell shape-determining protein MreD
VPGTLNRRVTAYLFVLGLLDLGGVSLVRVGGLTPSFLPLMILYAAFHWEVSSVLPMSLAVGVFRELFSSQPLGLELAGFAWTGLLLSAAVPKLERQSWTVRVLTGLIYITAISCFSRAGGFFFGFYPVFGWNHFPPVLASALYTVLWMPPFFWATAKLFHEWTPRKQYELFR